jgi:flagellin
MPVISTNTAANTALRYLNSNSTAQSESLAKLSSGSRIVSAKDDASGLAIATSMNADITVLNQAATNVTSGSSVLNTADGALSNIADILQRMKSLTAQAQSGSSSTDDLSYINAEYTQLMEEIDDIASTTNFNGVSLLSSSGTSVATTLGTAGTAAGYVEVATGDTNLGAVSYLADGTSTTIEVGDYVNAAGELLLNATGTAKATADDLLADSVNTVTWTVTAGTGTSAYTNGTGVDFLVGTSSSDTITVKLEAADTASLGIDGTSITSAATAATAMDAIDLAITQVSEARANVGATLSRFEYRGDVISTSLENLQSAKSAISDVDIASEQTNYTNASTLTSAAIAALGKANEMSQSLLKLLQ